MCGASVNRDRVFRIPRRLHHPPRRLARLTFSGSWYPAGRKGLAGYRLCRGLVSLGNLLSLSCSEGSSHLQFWGLQLLPYVGCLCLHDPSHINVIIRASIYTDFLLSTSSSCFAGVIFFVFPALLVQGYYSILYSRTDWEREGKGRETWQRQKKQRARPILLPTLSG